ncbi:MAG: DNRLRE domain-containing protein [Phycisphaerales bacterium]|jgi:hypothetical protein
MMPRPHVLSAFSATLAVAVFCQAETVQLTTVKDNTLIQDPSLALSAGAGMSFYAGRVGSNGGQTLRRGLLAFDIASAIPEGSTITSVALTLRCSKVPSGSGPQIIKLHRTLADWGEGTSVAFGGGGAPATPGDATWNLRFYPDVPWATPGGEFVATMSGATTVGAIGFYTWNSTPEMVADVQSWLDDPSTNFGWTVIGNEQSTQQVRRLETKESIASWRPKLVIEFEPPASNPADLNGDGIVNGADLAILLAAWGGDGPADLNGDGIVNGADLAVLLAAWN